MKSLILGIDPGTVESGYALYPEPEVVSLFKYKADANTKRTGVHLNTDLPTYLRTLTDFLDGSDELAGLPRVAGIEFMHNIFAGKGKAGQKNKVQAINIPYTLMWVGRLAQVLIDLDWTVYLCNRDKIKNHLGVRRGKELPSADSQVIHLMRLRFDNAVGNKAFPGPLFGVSSHGWQSLGVAAYTIDSLDGGADTELSRLT
jgi:hypothetical protein